MEVERAREIIKQLADGVDPTTGEILLVLETEAGVMG